MPPGRATCAPEPRRGISNGTLDQQFWRWPENKPTVYYCNILVYSLFNDPCCQRNRGILWILRPSPAQARFENCPNYYPSCLDGPRCEKWECHLAVEIHGIPLENLGTWSTNGGFSSVFSPDFVSFGLSRQAWTVCLAPWKRVIHPLLEIRKALVGYWRVDLRARFGRPLTCLKHCRMVMIHLRGFWTI